MIFGLGQKLFAFLFEEEVNFQRVFLEIVQLVHLLQFGKSVFDDSIVEVSRVGAVIIKHFFEPHFLGLFDQPCKDLLQIFPRFPVDVPFLVFKHVLGQNSPTH